ncbi:hypothetical protein ACFQU2_32655 [Siccirubricoccus deserti]
MVAERLGHPPDTALSLASAVAATAARAKARRLGIAEEGDRAKDSAPAKPQDTTRLLGKDVRLTHDADGVVLADAGEGKPAPAAPVAAYIARAFGSRLPEVREAMEALAARYDPDELNRIGFRLYAGFRPDIPEGVSGWGAKGELRLDRIKAAGVE